MNDVVDQAFLLENLSDADKDALIARLWRDLQEERARFGELERQLAQRTGDPATESREASLLLKMLQQVAARKPAPQLAPPRFSQKLGRRFAFLRSRKLIAATSIFALAFGLDFAIGRYQQYRLEQKRLADLRLQHAAFEGMYVEVVKVAYEPDEKSYRLTMKFTNDHPAARSTSCKVRFECSNRSAYPGRKSPRAIRSAKPPASSNSQTPTPSRRSSNPISRIGPS